MKNEDKKPLIEVSIRVGDKNETFTIVPEWSHYPSNDAANDYQPISSLEFMYETIEFFRKQTEQKFSSTLSEMIYEQFLSKLDDMKEKSSK